MALFRYGIDANQSVHTFVVAWTAGPPFESGAWHEPSAAALDCSRAWHQLSHTTLAVGVPAKAITISKVAARSI